MNKINGILLKNEIILGLNTDLDCPIPIKTLLSLLKYGENTSYISL